jgi:hypothetical protein
LWCWELGDSVVDDPGSDDKGIEEKELCDKIDDDAFSGFHRTEIQRLAG